MSEIKIQCPECHERFEVPEELMGEAVECGSCGHPFDLSEEHIDTLAMRHFPGEKADQLASFTKKSPDIGQVADVSLRLLSMTSRLTQVNSRPWGREGFSRFLLG
ncbi:MJ0042-type zinc finger domain-containing protein [Rubritalea tangerina]|uniref:MJ0042-type zinc finger domain-containing protein n=1 Tax=Rubritalea tangerina TaxID=430798 RepID=UPI00360CFFF2